VTGFLASVRSTGEVALALAGGADIIDAKEPSSGALGAVAPATLRGIVGEVAGRCAVSATIGDLGLAPENVLPAVEATAACGADIIKIGLFPGELQPTLDALRGVARRGVRLVAVAFADRRPDLEQLVQSCAECGFFGIMIDTANKRAGPLTSHLGIAEVGAFVALARRRGLVSGLAGSLGLNDVPALARLRPDYLGFRSALTVGGRDGDLALEAVRAVRQAIDAADQPSDAPRSSATATAGAMSAPDAASAASDVSIISSSPR
jgi:dihydroneopterin aldolase